MTRKLLSRRNLLVGAGVALAGGGAAAVAVQGMGSMAAYTARAAATRAPLADNVRVDARSRADLLLRLAVAGVIGPLRSVTNK